MAYEHDYIPKRDAEFDGWLENLTGYVEEKTAGGSWANIPADKVAALKDLDLQWHTAYNKTTGPHTNVDTESKNEAKKNAEQFVRSFVQQYLKFDPVTNEDRTAMRLHNRDTTHTVIPAPATRALITGLKAKGGFQIEVRFHDEQTKDSRKRPYGCNGCLLNYVWENEKATDISALSSTRLMTRSPWILTLPPESEGKFLSCCSRWQNERGELGPWGEIQHIAIA